jgi:hypothetical protein
MKRKKTSEIELPDKDFVVGYDAIWQKGPEVQYKYTKVEIRETK